MRRYSYVFKCSVTLSVDLRTSPEWTVRASCPSLSGQWKRVWASLLHCSGQRSPSPCEVWASASVAPFPNLGRGCKLSGHGPEGEVRTGPRARQRAHLRGAGWLRRGAPDPLVPALPRNPRLLDWLSKIPSASGHSLDRSRAMERNFGGAVGLMSARKRSDSCLLFTSKGP